MVKKIRLMAAVLFSLWALLFGCPQMAGGVGYGF